MENNQIDSLEDFYLTYTTFMIKLIDTDAVERMMKRVISDINNNTNSIIERIQNMDLDIRMLLGKELYNWTINERYFSYNKERKSFFSKFEDAFSLEVKEECDFEYEIRNFSHKINKKKEVITITIYPTRYLPRRYDFVNRAVLKFDNNTLKLSYIETPFHNNLKYEVELFHHINGVFKELKNENAEMKFSFHKKYQDVYEKAQARGYLKSGIEEN